MKPMLNKRKTQNRVQHAAIVAAAVFIITAGAAVALKQTALAQWSEPTGAPPGGTVAAPINISANAQTKAGDLTINPGNLFVGQGGGSSKFCLNADPVADINDASKCIAAWSDIGGVGKFVRLNPTSPGNDTGYVYLSGGLLTGDSTLQVVAPTANNQITAGILAFDSRGFSGRSYAIYAQSSASVGGALYAQSDNANTYAGYFFGRVGVFGDARISQGSLTLDAGDVFVGTVANPTMICLYGTGQEDCIDSWFDIVARLGGELWTELAVSPGVFHTFLTETNSNLAIGGIGYERTLATPQTYATEFFFNVSSGGKFALGLPTTLAPASFTCGDGACNGGELPATCVVDCPAGPIPQPDRPGNILSLLAQQNGSGNNKLTWQQPSNTGLVGVMLVRSAGSPPSTIPTDGQVYTSCNTLGNATVIRIASPANTTVLDSSASCSPPVSGTTYYYRVFAYNNFNNFRKYADGIPAGANASVQTQ